LDIFKEGTIITAEQMRVLDEKILNALMEKGDYLFQVYKADIIKMEINNTAEFFSTMEMDDVVPSYPIASFDKGNIKLESSFGWGKEDEVYATKVKIVRL